MTRVWHSTPKVQEILIECLSLRIFWSICLSSILCASNLCHGVENEKINIDSNSWEGKVGKRGIKLAADDVNNQTHLLNATRLVIQMREAQTLLQGVSAAVELLEREVVANPRRRTTQTSGEIVKIAVPRGAWKQLLSVSFDQSNNKSIIVTGFCKDVFDAVVGTLGYALPCVLLPYPDHSDNDTSSYDDLIREVYLKRFDTALGDITILGSRTDYVEFTQPFTEPGVAMLIPIKREGENNACAFLDAFSPAMWGTTAALVIYTGVVVWLLEHRINPAFRGRPITEVVTLLWFALSSVYFAHRERIQSNLARIVIVVWLFVALILTSTYTASLTSRLTIQHIAAMVPSDTTAGYQWGSIVGEHLQNISGITERNSKLYSTPEQYEQALSKGPNKGGVAAIYDEMPYIRAFLVGRCNYAMVRRTYKTGGFGFVFPKGSSLVADFSAAIIKLTEEGTIRGIEDKYFHTNCPESGESLKRYGLGSFWGLYLITGSLSSLALIIFVCSLLYNFRKDENAGGENSSKWKSIKDFATHLYQKEAYNMGGLSLVHNPGCNPEEKLEVGVDVMVDADQIVRGTRPDYWSNQIYC